MNIFSRNKNIPTPPETLLTPEQETRSFYSDAVSFNAVSSFVSSKSLRLGAVKKCVDALSNGIATLPINVYSTDNVTGFKTIDYKHPLNRILNLEPSVNMTAFNFFTFIINSILLKGSGYALINRDNKGNIISIKYLPFEWVTVNYNWKLDLVNYTVLGYPKAIDSKNILHFKINSNDFIHGVSVIDYAINTLQSASDAENHAANFFKSGAASNGLLKSSVKLDDKQKQDIKNSWFNSFSGSDSLGMAIIPNGLDYESISINPKDSMLLESRQYSVLDICRFFNVNPVKAFDLRDSNYSSLEQVNLDFLETSLKPYIKMMEDEFNRKLFNDSAISIKFDVTDMLSTDKVTTANYYKTLLQSGVLSVNEVRKALNFDEIEHGNNNYMQKQMSPLNLINNPVELSTQKDSKILNENTDSNTTESVN